MRARGERRLSASTLTRCAAAFSRAAFVAIAVAVVTFHTTRAAAQVERPSQPEHPSGRGTHALARADRYMVAAAHPLAVDAGLRMLERGGAAVDAAVATQLVLNLVEPHASGLGGGAFLLHYAAATGAMRAYDGRENAPAEATPELFLRTDGKPMAFREAAVGGRPVGVPGLARLLAEAHRRHGKLAWATLFEPAIEAAENGFPLSARTHSLLARAEGLNLDPAARAYFFDADGNPKPAGTLMRNPPFAALLRLLAREGADAFYRGEIARDIVAAVRNHPRNPGPLSEQDLASYGVRTLEPLCAPYRQYKICGMPPPSSGGIAVIQMLGMLERFDLARVRPGSAEAAHLIAEAGRLAYADRNRYVADDRYAPVPVAGLIDRAYLAARSQLIRPEASMGKAAAGAPPGAQLAAADASLDYASGTSHLVAVDANGNAVSMTTTIESSFGARIMVHGMLLNNQLTDFNFLPAENGRPIANRVEPGKRPRSSMAPKLVFDADGRLLMAVGSPGGSQIINYVLKMLVATLDWQLDIQAAIDMPNVGSRNGPTEVEAGTAAEGLVATLKAMGHAVQVIDMTSGVHGIMRAPQGWTGGSDPRREGVARGR
jgi:gamma-glutamyltranspeptidase/glutathione hydrolase